MLRNTGLMLSIGAALATVTLTSNPASAQFPPPPPMAGPPPIAAGGPPAFAARPPIGPGGVPHAGLGGPAPRLGAGAAPREALAGSGRGSPAVANAARATSVTYNRFGGYGRYGGARYGYRAAYAASAYAGAAAGYAYGGSRYSSDSDCYYVYRRYRRVMVCE
ncbi:hypothetical protein ACVIWV_009162 [Bradyrhizobium diazoefficiens]|uniref:hypothetical protein n=1 Tax=Bradyrhizobium TaxID=374 RepID=UPI0007658120|nr:hypothetical protein [Bradyrhizobium diazoefficiens]MBR0865789.1 hypothetical protein [Bradyrhizobium diazoefficiens]MBR0890348.1 hypothetical protein [Bradyrhizobium diazoefficiens]MBR0922121.1 hypothetical protein [Bradyrhizobium diazoefficiens]WLA64381.1 hypothetical protein QNN01_39720 [Bradyrhizobium diazoefficiens]